MITKQGFTIVEVLLAMFILISAIFVLSNLQMRAIYRVMKDKKTARNIYLVKKKLHLAMMPERKKKVDANKINKKLSDQISADEQSVKVAISSKDIDKKSKLVAFAKGMRMVKAEGTFDDRGKKQKIFMSTLIQEPEKKEEKKK